MKSQASDKLTGYETGYKFDDRSLQCISCAACRRNFLFNV